MTAQASAKPRIFRAGTILLLGWIALEIALMQMVAARIGWGFLLLGMAVKGGAGLVLAGLLMMRGLRAIVEAARSGSGIIRAADAGFPVASAVLIAIPGLIPSIVALALFAPALRRRIAGLFSVESMESPSHTGPSRDVDLDQGDWRELHENPAIPPSGAVKPGQSRDPLEGKAPSV